MKTSNNTDHQTGDITESQTQKPLSRWTRRKLAVQEEQRQLMQAAEEERLRKEQEASLPTDADMPPVESLTEDSDYSGFMSPKVSESLRRIALRKLFHSAAFNVCDGMDDYDEDFTSFEKLGNIITADMKHQMEMEARKKMELAQSEDAQGDQPAGQTDTEETQDQQLLTDTATDQAGLEDELNDLTLDAKQQSASQLQEEDLPDDDIENG
jgi:hypothetical protein